jgi:hypothetical protein
VKALFIPVDGPPAEVDLPGGGTRCAERIQLTSRWEAWLDEDGTTAGKPVNQAATLVARSFGFEFSLLGRSSGTPGRDAAPVAVAARSGQGAARVRSGRCSDAHR